MRIRLVTLLASVMYLLSCESNKYLRCLPDKTCGKYDVIIVAGQSNATSRGLSEGKIQSFNNERIWQISRRAIVGGIIPASEPLESVTFAKFGSGFALPFARRYRELILDANREILVVAVAKGATSVLGPDAYWRSDGEGVAEAATFGSSAAELPNSRIVAILWHQGESDINYDSGAYKEKLRESLEKIRGHAEIPVILGQLAPSFVDRAPRAARTNAAIAELAGDFPDAGLALSSDLETNGVYAKFRNDYTHFTAEAQRELGERYFCAFARLKFPQSETANSATCLSSSIVN